MTALAGCYTGASATGGAAGDADTDESPADDGGTQTDTDEPPGVDGCALTPRRVWKLTPAQIGATVATMVPGAAATATALAATLPHSGGFSNPDFELAMTTPHVADLYRFADGVAELVMADAAATSACLASAEPDTACIESFVRDFGAKAFRAPLGADEVDGFSKLYAIERDENGTGAAASQLVRGFLLSPRFLYRSELGQDIGDGTYKLTPHEVASAISYLVTDAPPDAELLAAAADDSLDSRDEVARQVERLLLSPATSAGVLRFFREHFRTDEIATIVKDPVAVPEFNADLAGAMSEEARRFIEYVLWEDDARFATLLTANYSVIDDRLAWLYGTTPTGSGQFERVELPSAERAGLLTQVGMMARLARQNTTDPVYRGKFIREVMMCQALPPPPDDVDAIPPPPSEDLTKREQLAIHSADPSCAACHALMDPLGLAFESYDSIGRFRLEENGKSLDLAGELDPGSGVLFDDSIELSRLLAEGETTQRCFVDTMLEYSVGHALDDGDRCAVDALGQGFIDGDGDVIGLITNIVTAERFVHRAGP